ncbi:MAG: hypothetical protein ACTHQM_24775, partial [Thermoanaerobaculia bacterium]
MTESDEREASDHLNEVAQTGTLNVRASEFNLLKQHLLADPFDFARVICGYRDLTDRYHRPLAYILGGCTDKLIALLNNEYFDSYVLSALRVELELRGINWNTPQGRAQLDELLAFVNVRMYRGSGKSSIGTHSTLLWYGTRNPNETIALMSVNDDGAHAFCRQVRDTMLGDMYRLFFPERLPEGDRTKLLTEERLWFGGRTIPHPQWTVEARGFLSSWARTHFSRFFTDDIVTEANCNPSDLRRIHRNLGNMRGLYMPRIRVARHHLGTVYDENDDHWFLSRIAHCLNIVVPIEIYPEGVPDSIEVRGIPTNPEWHGAEEIAKIQKEVSGDDKEGPLSYKRNFWLDPKAGISDRIFPPSLVAKARYQVVVEAKVTKIRRIADDNPITVAPRDLFIVLGIDPAFSINGDEWAITALGVDHETFAYQLETVSGQGWDALVSFMRAMLGKWKPRAVGYERAGAQEQNFKTLLAYDTFFRRHAHLFQSVTHENKGKDWRIIERVREPMASGRLLLNPADKKTPAEMVDYIPGPKAKDNRL